MLETARSTDGNLGYLSLAQFTLPKIGIRRPGTGKTVERIGRSAE